MNEFLDTIFYVTKSLLPLVGIIVLIILGVLLYKVIKIVGGLNQTVDKVNQTIDVVDKSIEKLQQPLQTVVSISHSIDSVHFFSEKAIRNFMNNANEVYLRVRDYVMQLFTKSETAGTTAEDVVEDSVNEVVVDS